MKPGVIAAAQRADSFIVPVHAEADRAWRLHSWDRFMIPKPAARIWVTYGEPFKVAPGEAGFAEAVHQADAALRDISGDDAWRGEAIAIG
jgi:lysophospholipid acyltransferase (LPLAT)-like uncharacterized protein